MKSLNLQKPTRVIIGKIQSLQTLNLLISLKIIFGGTPLPLENTETGKMR